MTAFPTVVVSFRWHAHSKNGAVLSGDFVFQNSGCWTGGTPQERSHRANVWFSMNTTACTCPEQYIPLAQDANRMIGAVALNGLHGRIARDHRPWIRGFPHQLLFAFRFCVLLAKPPGLSCLPVVNLQTPRKQRKSLAVDRSCSVPVFPVVVSQDPWRRKNPCLPAGAASPGSGSGHQGEGRLAISAIIATRWCRNLGRRRTLSATYHRPSTQTSTNEHLRGPQHVFVRQRTSLPDPTGTGRPDYRQDNRIYKDSFKAPAIGSCLHTLILSILLSCPTCAHLESDSVRDWSCPLLRKTCLGDQCFQQHFRHCAQRIAWFRTGKSRTNGTVSSVLFRGRFIDPNQKAKRKEVMDQNCRRLQLELFERDHPQWDWFPDEVQTQALEIVAIMLAEHIANTLEETDAESGD